MKKEKVADFYDSLAQGYDREQEEFSFVRRPEREAVLSTLDRVLRKDQTVLEIGAGTGRFTLDIAPRVNKITAVDLSGKMLEQLRRKAAALRLDNVRAACGDFMEMPALEQADVIVSISAIEYIRDAGALFARMGGLLKPGGQLVITTAHDTFFRFWGRLGNYLRQGVCMQAFSKNRMRKLLERNGLRVREMRDLCLKTFLTKGIVLLVHAEKTA